MNGEQRSQYPDIEPAFWSIYEKCRHATMTSVERMYALYNAVLHTLRIGAPGDFVECGVWRGGSVMLMAETLAAAGVRDRLIYLYDTFDGMPPPSERDKDVSGVPAAAQLSAAPRVEESVWAYASLEVVADNLRKTAYPIENFRLVRGKVEDTLPRAAPERIALLRLDTDWYESTRCELEILYPRLHPGGVLIIDDYGHWRGSKEAVDEYFSTQAQPILLHRVDYTGRVGIKPASA